MRERAHPKDAPFFVFTPICSLLMNNDITILYCVYVLM